MACDRIKLDGAPLGMAIVCSRGRRAYRCCACTLVAALQCDWKLTKTRTCDAFICPDHALEVAPGKHICPEHQPAYQAWKARREGKPTA